MIRSGLLALTALFLFSGAVCAADAPAQIYVMDFSIADTYIDFGQTTAVDMQLAGIVATALSNCFVTSFGSVAPAQRITDPSQAKAPGWLVTGSLDRLVQSNGFINAGDLLLITDVTVTDLAAPGTPLFTFGTKQHYNPNLDEIDPWRDADGGTGGTLSGPDYMHKNTALGNLTDAIGQVTTRTGKEGLYRLKKFLNGDN